MEKPMSMVERVAKAIQQASFRMIRPSWDSLDNAEKDQWRIRARAAIESLREPTEAMIEAGKSPGWSHWESRGRFNLMIDAALNEEPPSTPHQISIATSIVEMTNAALKEQD
jgi:hypothetical protein